MRQIIQGWRVKMKEYLKSKGAGIFGPIASKNLSKFAAQRRVRKNNEVALNILFNGLSDTIKESMGLCTSAKDLWLKLEKVYQIKREDTEDIPIKDEKEDSTINEGKDSPQSSIAIMLMLNVPLLVKKKIQIQ
jgi:hypothetical protein